MTILMLYVIEAKQNWMQRQCLGLSLNFLMQFCPQTAPRWFGHGNQYIYHIELQLYRGIKTQEANHINHIILVVLYTPFGEGILLL